MCNDFAPCITAGRSCSDTCNGHPRSVKDKNGMVTIPSHPSVDETVDKLRGILQARNLIANIAVVRTLAASRARWRRAELNFGCWPIGGL